MVGRFSSVAVRHVQFGFNKIVLPGSGFREHRRAGCLYVLKELARGSGVLLEALHLRSVCMPSFCVVS